MSKFYNYIFKFHSMNIKKNSKNSFTIENVSDKVKVVVTLSEDGLNFQIDSNGRTFTVDKPGDYEYGKLGILALENTDKDYTSKINMTSLVTEGINIATYVGSIEPTKDSIDNIGSIDILITRYLTGALLKKIIDLLEPRSLILFKSMNNDAEFDIETLKKDLGIVSVSEESYLKLKQSDFDSEGDFVMNAYIIK